MSEIQIQAEIFQYCWNMLPETQFCLYHVKNEIDTKYNKASAIMLKQQVASGLIAGIQDLHLLWKGNSYRFEVKTETGQLSLAQKLIHAVHAGQGFNTYLIRYPAIGKELITTIVKNIDYLPAYNQYISPYSNQALIDNLKNQYFESLDKRKIKSGRK